MRKERIGFAGLGIMGRPMALNILNAGFSLVVYDIDRESVTVLRNAGADAAVSPKALAESSDIIFCMLPDAPQIMDLVFGDEGLLQGISAGKLFVDMSTTDSKTELIVNEALSAKGADSMDAPVSGGQPGAINGKLSVMAGGNAASFERALPVFEVLGKEIKLMGGHGAGQITKSCCQIATALTTQGIVESFSLAKKAGIELGLLKEVMAGGFAASRALQITGEKIIQGDFQPGFKLALYKKDLRIALNAGLEKAVDLPGTALVSSEMGQLIRFGKGEADFSALIQLFELDHH